MAKKHRAKATVAARQVWAVLLDSMVVSFLGIRVIELSATRGAQNAMRA